jgi:hypothetical protein
MDSTANAHFHRDAKLHIPAQGRIWLDRTKKVHRRGRTGLSALV